jgi:hypothetical protein
VPVEVVICDWGSEVPATNVLPCWPNVWTCLVSPETAKRWDTPFYETKALNLAARESTGTWIGRIDQDTIVGRRFFSGYRDGGPQPGGVYFCGRRDLPPGATVEDDAAPYNHPPRDRSIAIAVGILLLERTTWHETRGYCEAMQHFNHMEIEWTRRLARAGRPMTLIGEQLDVPFYHLHHTRADCDARPHNPPLPEWPENGQDWGTVTLVNAERKTGRG